MRRAKSPSRRHIPNFKVSFATTIAPSRGGQFILHAKAMPGAPYDGHTLESVIPDIEAITGATLSRILADAGYKGHKTPPGYKFKVYTQGQKRGVTKEIRRLFKRRAAIEPVIGHTKSEHRLRSENNASAWPECAFFTAG